MSVLARCSRSPSLRAFPLLVVLLTLMAAQAGAEEALSRGWRLDSDASELRVMSIKKGSTVESSEFAAISGTISESGDATVEILLDSIDTKVDLRNVRMRFLFFETFAHPRATVSLRIDPALLADLSNARHLAVDLPYSLDLHGVTASRTDRVWVTLLDTDTVAVSSAAPIPIAVGDFGLEEGRIKLQEAANVDIVPVGTISFNFLFRRNEPTGTSLPAVAMAPETLVKTAALEPEGVLEVDACAGRFEILSRAGNIYFRSGSARLDEASNPLLDTLLNVVERCPSLRIEIEGHTDSDGSDLDNQRLSEARARAVMTYLLERGAPGARLTASGYGESRPVRPNTTADNKSRNRRIEFSVRNE